MHVVAEACAVLEMFLPLMTKKLSVTAFQVVLVLVLPSCKLLFTQKYSVIRMRWYIMVYRATSSQNIKHIKQSPAPLYKSFSRFCTELLYSAPARETEFLRFLFLFHLVQIENIWSHVIRKLDFSQSKYVYLGWTQVLAYLPLFLAVLELSTYKRKILDSSWLCQSSANC